MNKCILHSFFIKQKTQSSIAACYVTPVRSSTANKALTPRHPCPHSLRGMSGTLFVTLRRGTAGKKADHLKTLFSLGLRRPRDVRELPNDSGIRGSIDKVKHLVRVETSEDVERRIRIETEKRAPRPPIEVKH